MRKSPFLMSTAFLAVAMVATPASAQDSASQPENQAQSGQAVATPGPTAEAAEEEEASGPFELELNLTGVSDYRFRGVSLSDKDPAFQPSITLSHESGLYASVWGSNVAENDGSDIEVDYIIGFAPTVGPVDLDLNATYYAYPGADNLNYWEFIGNVSHSIGDASIGFTFAYTPKQDSTVPSRGLYYAIQGELPIKNTPLTLAGSFGIEDNAFYDKKKDWSIGLNADVGAGFTVGGAYVDTAHSGGDPLGKPTVVFTLSKSFTTSF
jgi:uncharacterized protein (TIGR02001 family)